MGSYMATEAINVTCEATCPFAFDIIFATRRPLMYPFERTPSPSSSVVHNDITLELRLEDPAINLEVLLLAWEELHPYSVEAVTARCQDMFEFATSHQCVVFAAIQLKITKPIESTADGEELGRKRPTPIPEPVEEVEMTIETIGILYLCTTEMQLEYNVGLSLLAPWRNLGHASQALTAALTYAFTILLAHRVQALIMDGPCSDAARS
ncbi:hypothetical protein EVJ58_g7725, partial [Rhodofomes roseus]